MEGYNKPEITREDMAEAENVFLSITSDGEIYRGKMTVWARYLSDNQDGPARRFLGRLVSDYANHLERGDMCNGPISYMARAVAAGWVESYYRDHIAAGGLAT